jgi:hypothetical protein
VFTLQDCFVFVHFVGLLFFVRCSSILLKWIIITLHFGPPLFRPTKNVTDTVPSETIHIENEKSYFPKYIIYTPGSIYARITFGSDYSCEHFWVSLRALHTWIVLYLPIILFKTLQALSNWLLIIARQPFSSLAIDFQADLSQTVTQTLRNIHCLLGKQLHLRFVLFFCYCPAER